MLGRTGGDGTVPPGVLRQGMPGRRSPSAIAAAVAVTAILVAGCGAAHRSHGSAASEGATDATLGPSAGQSASATKTSHPATSRAGQAGSSAASAGATTPRRTSSAVNTFGPWTVAIIGVDGTHVGAVTIGMTTAQAEHASGLTPWSAADGIYRPAGLRPGFDKMFFREDGTPGRVSCIGAQQAAPVFLGQRVQTTAGVGVGDPVARLRAVYGNQLREIPKPASGATASAGYVVTVTGGRISFATDDARTRITGIGVGPNATPTGCP